MKSRAANTHPKNTQVPPPPRGLSLPFHFQKFSLPVLLCQKNGQNFGGNVNGLLILFEKMSSHFVLIIPLVSNRLIWQKRKDPRCTTCTFKHHHSSAKMHMTVSRDEQHQHCCAIVAVLKIFHALRKHCSSLQKRCDRDKIRLKLIEDWYSTVEDVKSWHGVLGVKYKHILQMLQTRGQATNDPKIRLNEPFDSSFTADFKVRTFQNSFLSAYFNLMWV